MLARVYLLLLLAGAAGAATVEPKPRPRLPAPVITEMKREVAGPATRFRSFDDYLQAEARQPVGLEAVPEIAAARAEKAAGDNKPTATTGSAGTAGRTEASGSADVLVLPKLEITAERLTKLEKQIAALEANQAWEENSARKWSDTRGSVLNSILNPPFFRLGGYTPEGKAAVARQRSELLRWVRVLQISLHDAKTPEEQARIQADIESITGIMRMWE